MTQKTEQDHLYKRVLLKISGEALMGDGDFGINPDVIDRVAKEVKAVHESGVQVCLVVGGGNIFRGVTLAGEGMNRVTGDHMGMLATIMNALAMRAALQQNGVDTRVQSAIPMAAVCEPFILNKALRHLEKGRVVVFAAGSGNPFFTTDTAAALRASEMACDAILKGTKVDGVYNRDPAKDPTATRYEELTYRKVLSDDLGVMDHAAISLARENHIPIIVFSIAKPGAMAEVVRGEGTFTVVKE